MAADDDRPTANNGAPRTTRDAGPAAPRTTLDAGSATPRTTRDAGPSAPRTTRDAAPHAPRTTRDAVPETPRTTRDAAPETPRTTLDDAPDTPRSTRDLGLAAPSTRTGNGSATGGSGTGAFRRVNLPPDLDELVVAERDLDAGGEADIVLARRRDNGEHVVIRLYRRLDTPVDAAKLDRLRAADPRHLIRLLEWRSGEHGIWEMLEYAEHGSLADLMQRTPGRWSPAQVRVVLEQTAAALEYAHSLQFVHRDIKPQNLLVRSLDPLDLVIADFGLATVVAQTREMRQTTSRTSAYAAPEAATGEASRALDWWSLGMVLVELLTGQHPFQRRDRTWMSDVMIVRELTVHDIDVSDIHDDSWELLCRGLLTRSPEHRWGAEQVRQWLGGARPRVVSGRQGPQFAFANALYSDPVELGRAFREHWPAARRLLKGQANRAPAFLNFREWAEKLGLDALTRTLDRPNRENRLVAQVIRVLDPEGPAVFAGYEVTSDRLAGMVQRAGQEDINAFFRMLFDDGALAVYDGLPGCDGYALVDERWHQSVDHFDQQLAVAPGYASDSPPARLARAQLLLTSFPGQEGALRQQATAAGADPEARHQPWFRGLCQAQVPPHLRAAQDLVITLLRPYAADLTARQRAEAHRQAQIAEQRRLAERRNSLDRASGPIGLALALGGCFVPFVGIFAGPAAVYFGVRGRRVMATGSTAAIVIGVISTIVWVIYLMTVVAGTAASNS
ncbi:protein kinase domain-containing protein [Cryptosporangium aurantiacum]|uniref:Protein kinase domain-containing protein n=1 Tax=Cryptosporangium aurantiacum TaxID=134849 RepID=A0A1M7R1F5_9ACTN|nr:protein kinase [Cryptosporangium aurantiacum]SHN38278.1 Protein kinase domain-containing protein [Cryptosporangium aurantiacum]